MNDPPIARLLVLWTSLVLCGCGARAEPLGTVTGRVTMQGQPVTVGTVIFLSADGTVSVLAPLREDGSFEAVTHDRKGLPPGRYRVAVKPTTVSDGPPPLAGDKTVPVAPRTGLPIPAKFHSVDTSNLTADVRPGDNPPFELALSP